ncbi:hypothetical protein DH2020_021089 [Rehmannia glutinosa]|uniref:Glycosyltransferase 2-like domain-containing protein n=1 Tax=Rehmannia glutinosa TaxID=99300 RepID=A0ABR0WD79_REHGL
MAEISVKNLALEWLLGSTVDVGGQIGHLWKIIRVWFVVPLLRVSLYICLVLSTMLFLEWVYIGGIPLFNEKEVYKLSIGAACNLSWPADRILIQVMDGSTDTVIKDMVEKECARWACEGVNIRYQVRETRGGFKAGALKEGLTYEYVRDCEHVAIFDADFQPEPDFLRRAVPFLVHNPDIALVQARWRFVHMVQRRYNGAEQSVNADECLLTRLQEISMDYHFTAEQEVGSSAHAFFGFNGSGGIWRIGAIKEAGGWDARTTAEDMDLAVRAGLKGWKLVYVGSLQVKSELPSTYKAFRSQQHRWFCGPTNLFRKIAMDIAKCKIISFWKKVYMIYNFFFVRKIVGHTCIFFSYCVVLPLTILIPEVDIPKWGAVFMPCIITAINSVFATPRSLHLVLLWVLFESAMSFHLTKAIFMGLLGTKSVNEWVVTEKLGDASKIEANGESDAPKESRLKVLRDRSGYGSETGTLKERFCAGSGSWKWGCNMDAMAFSTERITISFTYFFKLSHLQLWDLASLVKYSQAIHSSSKNLFKSVIAYCSPQKG